MRKAQLLLVLGVFMAILPYLGFPSSWKDVLFTLSGFVVVYFSYVFYKKLEIKEKEGKIEKAFDNFIENI